MSVEHRRSSRRHWSCLRQGARCQPAAPGETGRRLGLGVARRAAGRRVGRARRQCPRAAPEREPSAGSRPRRPATLTPSYVDGWQQGWLLTGDGPVTAEFAPDGAYRPGCWSGWHSWPSCRAGRRSVLRREPHTAGPPPLAARRAAVAGGRVRRWPSVVGWWRAGRRCPGRWPVAWRLTRAPRSAGRWWPVFGRALPGRRRGLRVAALGQRVRLGGQRSPGRLPDAGAAARRAAVVAAEPGRARPRPPLQPQGRPLDHPVAHLGHHHAISTRSAPDLQAAARRTAPAGRPHHEVQHRQVEAEDAVGDPAQPAAHAVAHHPA